MENEETHEEMIARVVASRFNEVPRSIERMTMGICNEVYDVELSHRGVIVRLSTEDHFLKGSSYRIPLLRALDIRVPELLFEDYSRTEIPFAYQFLSKIEGKDIGCVIADLTDDQLKTIASEMSEIMDKVRTIPASDKFGFVWSDECVEFSDTWTQRMRILIDEAIERGRKTGIMDDGMQSILEDVYQTYKPYFDGVKPISYLDDICSKNVMVDNGKFSGLVDLDGSAQGDPLEAIGRIRASWFGTHYGEVYTEAIMDKQNLDAKQRRMVSVYALLNRISWACENGIQFNDNTSAKIDRKKEANDKELILALYQDLLKNGI